MKEDKLNFQLRVLDLLETFVRRERRSEMVPEMVVPMLDALRLHRNTKQKALHQRINTFLTSKLCNKAKQ